METEETLDEWTWHCSQGRQPLAGKKDRCINILLKNLIFIPYMSDAMASS